MAKQNRIHPLPMSQVLVCLLAGIVVACGLLVTSTIGCGLLLSVGPNALFRRHPSDEQMIETYYRQKTEFNQLAQMLQNEKDLVIIFSGGGGKCQDVEGQKLLLASENSRCQEYVRLLNVLGLERADRGREALLLLASSSGLSVSGSSKGYLYSTNPPDEIVDDTDANRCEGIVFRHIEGYWYIFFEST